MPAISRDGPPDINSGDTIPSTEGATVKVYEAIAQRMS